MGDSYDVVIRTLGFGGGKYEALLKSIKEQTVPPRHVYIFLAEGYSPPKERMGREQFIYTRKGMWHQRCFGMEYAASQPDAAEYQLVLDDDVAFDCDFVENNVSLMGSLRADIIVPRVGQLNPTQRTLLYAFLGSQFTKRNSSYWNEITATAGHTLRPLADDEEALPTQSAPFNGFFIKSQAIGELKLRDESWLDDATYALPDDQVFFYKAYLAGVKAYYCPGIVLRHLDHGSSSPGRKEKAAFASGRNFYVFWHRYLWLRAASSRRKSLLLLGITYRIVNNALFQLAMCAPRKTTKVFRSYLSGVAAGMRFCRSSSYKKLPRV